jgi:hypothetical protein
MMGTGWAAIQIDADDCIVTDNTVAGSDFWGFLLNFADSCHDSGNNLRFRNNVAHSVLIGVFINAVDPHAVPAPYNVDTFCMKISGFTISWAFDFGVYGWVPDASVHLEDTIISGATSEWL